ncbi:MAG: tetratricopeptide repeat protein [Gemmataceae bacterium]
MDRNHVDAPAILEALGKGFDVAYRWPDAGVVLSRLIDRCPNHVPALILRGTVAERTRRFDPAGEDFRRAVSAAPSSAVANAALAGFLTRRGYTAEAIRHYETALPGQPSNPKLLLGLARAFTDAADLNAAQQRLDELLLAVPDHADGLVERGRLALRRGRFAEAESFLARAVGVAPWHRDASQLQLIALKELGRSDDVAKCESRIAALALDDGAAGRLHLRARDNPGVAAVRWQLWEWCARNGQIEEGIAWLTEVLRLDPKNAAAHAAMADHFDKAGQPHRAAQHRLLAKGGSS